MREFAGHPLPRADVLGVAVHAIDMATAVQESERLLASGGKGYVCVTGVHGIMEARADATLLKVLNNAFLCMPDGMPTVWVGHLQRHRQMRRVYGPDYMMEMCRRSQYRGWRHFLCGGRPGVAELLASRLRERMPRLQIVGTFTPAFGPLNAAQEHELAELIDRARPDIIWVGLSTPKQERFMARYIEQLNVKLMVGVGAAFDLHAGLRRDAPAWIKHCGLQWLHRLCQEPARLGPRYLQNNPRFIWEICRQLSANRT